ncbi:HIT family protein [Rothia sp. CCM 9418]|uniref:HIT family protein n=1 Tax=Rothia sp. CCM 9418 TaxID=3402661 RepID=UPI003ADF9E34
MTTIFTKIMTGELPGHIVYEDDQCAAFLTIEPVNPGHTLVVPREEIDHWVDLPDGLRNHLFAVAQKIAQAQRTVFDSERSALMIAGFEVPHTHLHVYPANSMADFSPEAIQRDVPPEELAQHAQSLREALAK